MNAMTTQYVPSSSGEGGLYTGMATELERFSEHARIPDVIPLAHSRQEGRLGDVVLASSFLVLLGLLDPSLRDHRASSFGHDTTTFEAEKPIRRHSVSENEWEGRVKKKYDNDDQEVTRLEKQLIFLELCVKKIEDSFHLTHSSQVKDGVVRAQSVVTFEEIDKYVKMNKRLEQLDNKIKEVEGNKKASSSRRYLSSLQRLAIYSPRLRWMPWFRWIFYAEFRMVADEVVKHWREDGQAFIRVKLEEVEAVTNAYTTVTYLVSGLGVTTTYATMFSSPRGNMNFVIASFTCFMISLMTTCAVQGTNSKSLQLYLAVVLLPALFLGVVFAALSVITLNSDYRVSALAMYFSAAFLPFYLVLLGTGISSAVLSTMITGISGSRIFVVWLVFIVSNLFHLAAEWILCLFVF